MTICPICFPAFSKTTAAGADAIRVRAGWTAPAAGYFLTDTAMRDTIAGWSTARKEADISAQALEALRAEITLQTADMKRQLSQLNHELATERAAWRRRVRRGKTQGFLYGVFVGFAGGYLVKRNNP